MGSARSSNKCRCGHSGAWHPFSNGGACTADRCRCHGFVCDHTRCGWKPREEPEYAQSDFLRCQCGCFQMNHRPVTKGGCINCACDGFKLKVEPERLSLTAACACSHVNNWHVRADHNDTHCAATGCPCGAFRASSEDEEPRCEGCGHEPHIRRCIKVTWPDADVTAHCGCALLAPLPDPEEPPLTPEEEEEAAEGECCGECKKGQGHAWCGPCSQCEPEGPPPPQPERRPPYAVAYSVQGHLFEVALPGDATVRAVDGALVIQHHLGPIAGIVSVLPIINKES